MNRHRLMMLGLLALAGALSAFYFATRTTITVHADGQVHTVTTHAGTVGEALTAAGIDVFPEDIVRPAVDERLEPDLAVSVDRAVAVRVEADGQTFDARTHLASPLAILAAAGVSLSPQDEVWVDGLRLDRANPARPSVPRHLVVRRAVPAMIVDGDAAATVLTAERTVGEALWRAGYYLYRADIVEPALDTPLTPAMTITIRRARPITLLADGQTLTIRTRETNVAGALIEANLVLVGEDYAVPAADQPLPPDGLIRVVRVREEVLLTQETIAFQTVYQALPNYEIDTVFLVQAGAPGLRQRRIRVRYEDGAEVSRVDEGEAVVRAPAARVIGYGTQITIRTLDTPDGPVEYWRAYDMYATSYAAKFLSRPPTSPHYGRTASGKILTKGLVAIDRRYISFGTRMYVPGYGYAEAADTGGGVKGRWIDLGFDDWNYVSWHRVVTVYFLTPIPPANQITWLIPSTVP